MVQADKGIDQPADSYPPNADNPADLIHSAHSPNIDATLQVFKESASQKRKKKPQREAGPAKNAFSSTEGLVDVTVSYDHALQLALGFGIPIATVQVTAQEVLKEYEVCCSRVNESPLQLVELGNHSEEWADTE